MRKVIFWIIGIMAAILLLANWQNVVEVLHAMSQGAVFPLVCAAFFEFGRYAFQARANVEAFEAVGETASWSKMFQLILSGNFVNTLVPSGGTVYYALVIDDASERGIPVGKSTSASVMMQMFLLAGFIAIMLVGFTIMQAAGTLTMGFFLCGMFIVVLVGFCGAALFICRRSPGVLRSIVHPIEKAASKVIVKLRRSHKPPKPWADRFVDQLYAATKEMAAHRKSSWLCFLNMTLANGFEMMCFILVGLAFDVTAVNALLGGYVITHIFTIVSPSPNGVGVAEATAAVVLTSFGVPVATSTAIALTYRGFVFWIPFAIGALLLSRTGFFSKKNETEEEKAKQTGYLAALFSLVFGISNIVFALLPATPDSLNMLSQWLSIGDVFSASVTVCFSVALLLMTRGLRKRSRTTWAWTMLMLVYLAISQFVGSSTVYSGIAILVFAVWLFVRRDRFDQLLVYENSRSTISPILYVVLITLGYGICGFVLLAGQFEMQVPDNVFWPLVATVQTLLPFVQDPTALTDRAGWFIRSVRMVGGLTVVWAVFSILFPWVRRQRYEGNINNDSGMWKAVTNVEEGLLTGSTGELFVFPKASDSARKKEPVPVGRRAKGEDERFDVRWRRGRQAAERADSTVDPPRSGHDEFLQQNGHASEEVAEEDKIMQDIMTDLAEHKRKERRDSAIMDRLEGKETAEDARDEENGRRSEEQGTATGE